MNLFLESCCTSVAEVLSAQILGASRIELCSDLSVGGVTPPPELIREVMKIARIPVNVLIRPRGGDFRYTQPEVLQMISDIAKCRKMNVNGVVIGALDRDGNMDSAVMGQLVDAAGPLKKTFHRAFDCCREPRKTLGEVIRLGFDHLLTSGHAPDAFLGRHLIAELITAAGDSLTVMPGKGVRADNIEEIRRITGACEFHASAAFWRDGTTTASHRL